MKKILFILFILLIVGCTPRVKYVNRTIEKPIEVIKECPTFDCPDCICNQKECPTMECDNSNYKKCELQTARLINEVEYYKNLSISNIMNYSNTGIKEELAICRKQREQLNKTLEDIKKQLS